MSQMFIGPSIDTKRGREIASPLQIKILKLKDQISNTAVAQLTQV